MTMDEENTLNFEKMRAVGKIAESIGSHRPVKRDGLPGSTCSNRVCAKQGTVFLTLNDIYHHQAIVAANDLLASLRFDRILDLEEADVPVDAMEDDFTFSVLTDILDAKPAGRSYADREARRQRLEARQATTVAESPAPLGDPRLAPAVNAFRKEMHVRGVETSIGKVHASMIEALAAADAATRKVGVL